mmetsp:Transcript_69773/g.153894  ORF Transcript_69773/g.153894 Transcript_69773/m.153894 type:complete len:233 (-) Transcript_69773:25-723(-)
MLSDQFRHILARHDLINYAAVFTAACELAMLVVESLLQTIKWITYKQDDLHSLQTQRCQSNIEVVEVVILKANDSVVHIFSSAPALATLQLVHLLLSGEHSKSALVEVVVARGIQHIITFISEAHARMLLQILPQRGRSAAASSHDSKLHVHELPTGQCLRSACEACVDLVVGEEQPGRNLLDDLTHLATLWGTGGGVNFIQFLLKLAMKYHRSIPTQPNFPNAAIGGPACH